MVDSDTGKRLRRLVLEDGSLLLNKVKPKCFAKLKGHTTVFPNTPEFLIVFLEELDDLVANCLLNNSRISIGRICIYCEKSEEIFSFVFLFPILIKMELPQE
jgi:hypothetical protein